MNFFTTRKYRDPRGPLYRRMTFTERYSTELMIMLGLFSIFVLFLLMMWSIPSTIASVV